MLLLLVNSQFILIDTLSPIMQYNQSGHHRAEEKTEEQRKLFLRFSSINSEF